MMDSSQGDSEPWYSQRAYARYWQHYNQAMQWMHRHQNAYRKAMLSFYNSPWYLPALIPNSRYADWGGEDQSAKEDYFSSHGWHNRSQYPRWSQQPPGNTHSRQRTPKDDQVSSTEEESDSDGEIECDLSNMEITEELRQYFAETERHREELKRQQQLEAEHQDVYVEADHDLHPTTGRSVQPPSERPGERRMVEMKKLYGESAAKIQAMETAMQLTFDKNCDKKQPKYWPVIPLKL
ncbi:gem-associated protein 8 [Antechinus flavipes]|uniref:gem-associated protein 8 n=1 Tax=Antechinus flavipes TaxID=38775 RepID=UPI002235893D|nr:gem-associated protein 8 [Antechinus flavipes]